MDDVILVMNSGSSSIKFSIYLCRDKLHLFYHGAIDGIFNHPCFIVYDENQQILKKNIALQGHESALQTFFHWFDNLSEKITLKAVGHRVVHGGKYFFQPILVNDDVIRKIAFLNSLAPLHQPHNLEAIQIIQTMYPTLAQVACFDTSFHQTQKKIASHFAIPRSLSDEGIIRYGFHGISYEYIVSVMTQYIGDSAKARVIVAHLGNGASMCAIYQGKSVATTMGLTALDGLMMGTRCGQIDPGVLLYLLQEKNYSAKEIEDLLYNQSGLLGVSGISHDMRELLESCDKNAMEAIDLFCYRAAMEFGSLAIALNGCDAFIFTAGIGENAPVIRKKICEKLSWLGIKLDNKANEKNSTIISNPNSKMIVSVIPTNEEYMIAKHVQAQIYT